MDQGARRAQLTGPAADGLIEILNTLGALTVLLLIVAPAHAAEPSRSIYTEHCAVCHGDGFEGAAQGVALVGRELAGGDSIDAIGASIANGNPAKGMPAWADALDDQAIKALALLIAEHRTGLAVDHLMAQYIPDGSEWTLPSRPVTTQLHTVTIELVAEGLGGQGAAYPKPYSIAVQPDGSILVTETTPGMRIVSPAGRISDYVTATPRTDLDVPDLTEEGDAKRGAGWILDVALHPEFAENRWIYLHYTERCSACGSVDAGEQNPLTSRNVLVRGRIRDGRWVDEEKIWQAPTYDASSWGDAVTGGRIAFDDNGYVFITAGMRSMDGIQDLGTAYGKTHRLHDDGRIPADNPFVGVPGALSTIWTYGHRAPQGLAYDARTRNAWNTEHGPRGGDELNRLLPGRNYGWPLFSAGLNYDGTEVAWGRAESEIALEDTERAAKAWSPSIAVSNLVVYEGAAFPEWQGDLLIGSLKASDLIRVEVEDGRVVGEELLLEDLARLRDVDVDERGWIYLLLEHQTGGRIVRLKPAPTGG